MSARDFPRALDAFCRAVAFASGSAEAWGELGWAQFQLGDVRRARETTEAALQIARAGRRGPLYYNLGRILSTEGLRNDAIDAYQASLSTSTTEAAIDGLRDALSEDTEDPFSFSKRLVPLLNPHDYCPDDAGEVISCHFFEINDGLIPIKDVRWLIFDFSTDHFRTSVTRRYFVVDGPRGRSILPDEIWKETEEDDPEGTIWKIVSSSVSRKDALVGRPPVFVIDWDISVRFPKDAFLSESFLRVCATDDPVAVRCTYAIPYSIEEEINGGRVVSDSYSLDYDLAPPGAITFHLPMQVPNESGLPPRARRLLGTHTLHVPPVTEK
jgi:hypothetical protein